MSCILTNCRNALHSFRVYSSLRKPSIPRSIVVGTLSVLSLVCITAIFSVIWSTRSCSYTVPDLEFLIQTNHVVTLDFKSPAQRTTPTLSSLNPASYLKSVSKIIPLAELKPFLSLFSFLSPKSFSPPSESLSIPLNRIYLSKDKIALQLLSRSFSDKKIFNSYTTPLKVHNVTIDLPPSCQFVASFFSSPLYPLFAMENKIRSGSMLSRFGMFNLVPLTTNRLTHLGSNAIKFIFFFIVVSFISHKLYFKFIAAKRAILLYKDATDNGVEVDDFRHLLQVLESESAVLFDPLTLQFGISFLINKVFPIGVADDTLRLLTISVQFGSLLASLTTNNLVTRTSRFVFVTFVLICAPLCCVVPMSFPVPYVSYLPIMFFFVSLGVQLLLSYTIDRSIVLYNEEGEEAKDAWRMVFDCNKPFILSPFFTKIRYRRLEDEEAEEAVTSKEQLDRFFDWLRVNINEEMRLRDDDV
ncbi:hypothetical protein RCL1_000754 [Eukaryota sp. TZLM3-RCL]